jgi:ribosomal protein L40E/vacuolar-type H+-ATPase subunit I/STV1
MAISDKIGNVFNKAKSGTIAVSLEAKKKMKESSIKGEISSMEAKMNGVFTQIGREAYEIFPDTLAQNEKTKELTDSVAEIKQQIAAKEKELEEEMKRFDDEIAAVKEPQQSDAAPTEEKAAEPAAQATGEAKRFCTNCGAQNSADAAFCASCGSKMK